MKSVLWKVAKRLSYIQDARCLKVKHKASKTLGWLQRHDGSCQIKYVTNKIVKYTYTWTKFTHTVELITFPQT